MKLFESKQDMRDKIESLEAELAQSEQTTETAESTITELKADIVTKDEALATSQAAVATLETEKAELESKVTTLEQSLADTKEEVEQAEQSTSDKAIEIAAAAGHEPVQPESTTSDEDNSPEGLYAQFKLLKATNPAQATRFWNQHESELKQITRK